MNRAHSWPVTLDQLRAAEARFWSKVKKTDGCWVWIGAMDHGYGEIRIGGRAAKRPVRANRVAFAIANGRLPVGLICHRCDNPACVRPDHLFEGTQKDNIQDASRKGRLHRGPRNYRLLGELNGQAKLTAEIVRKIRSEYADRTATPTQIARRHGVGTQAIWSVIYRRTWAHVE